MYDRKRYNKIKPLDEAIRDYQLKAYDARYLGASLSKILAGEEVLKTLLTWMENPKNFLVIIGPPGTGKTYMLAAMVEWMFCTFNNFRTFKDSDILKKLRLGMSEPHGDWAEELKYMMDDELTIIDDLGNGIDPAKEQQKSIEWRSEVMFTMLDLRYNSMLPTIITSNLSRKDIQKIYSERACSRMFASENTIIDMNGMPDKRKEGL